MQGGSNDYHANHDVFESSDAEYISNISGYMMKPVAHGHLLCSALIFVFCYKSFVSEKSEEQASTRKYAGKLGFESHEN